MLYKLEDVYQIRSYATPPRFWSVNSVHHAGFRLATGVFPFPSLFVDAGVLPLNLPTVFGCLLLL